MAKGERSIKKIMTKDKLAEEDKQSYIGALEVNHYVKVKLNNELKICKIIAVEKIHNMKMIKILMIIVMNIIYII